MSRHLRIALLALLLTSCADSEDSDVGTVDTIDGTFSQTLTTEEIDGALRYVNDCVTTQAVLDDDAMLDARAARNIVEVRDGADERCGTADDRPLMSLKDLDSIPWVGDVALARIVAHAKTLGYVQSSDASYEGVTLSAADARIVLEIANGASLQMLDEDIGLDSRAANAMVAARPFSLLQVNPSMQKLVDLPYIGQDAVENLKAYVTHWSGCSNAATEVDGVAFSSLQVHDTLDFINQAPRDLLTEVSGIGPVLAERIVDARPFEEPEQFGDVSGVGPSLLTNVNNELSERWCPRLGAQCGCPMKASYRPPFVTFDEAGLNTFLEYHGGWVAERVVGSGFLSPSGDTVMLTDVQVANDPDNWQDITEWVFARLWDCCLQYAYEGAPLELGGRRGFLHIGRVVNANDRKPYVLAHWEDIDDSSFAWLFAKNPQGAWDMVQQVYLN